MGSNDVKSGIRKPGVKIKKKPSRTKKRSESVGEHVTKDMMISQIVMLYPQTTEIMAEYGLHCFGCAASGMESLAEGMEGHGFTDEDIGLLVQDINERIEETPPRPQTLIITASAAEGIMEIAKKEGKKGQGLSVLADEHGGFFMEFRKEADRGDKTFTPEGGPNLEVFASPLTLQRIGGATIDMRDGRFKLDVEGAEGGCACGGKCACK